ncbi:MAG: type II toxin-antitoxin system VapC family toxin [Prevotellaceae bacterium]|jgi:predicted nucleic acid-binding protein|nr:type II toxin-antitoxin system VapC family toxin [Prevotellaceae bacterium]
MTKKIYYQDKNVKVFVDTNILHNYCTKQPDDVACMEYLFGVRTKSKLLTSTLAVGQTLSHYKKNRIKEAVAMGKFLLSKMTFISFTEEDIVKSFREDGNDIEDNMHYVCSQKSNTKCGIVVSNDKTGFEGKAHIVVVKSKRLSVLKTLIS